MCVAPVSASASVHGNSQPHETQKKRKLRDADEAEHKGMDVEPEIPLIDAESLCYSAAFANDANEVVATYPDLLSSIVLFRLTDLLAFLKSPMAAFESSDQQKIERTVKVLYSMSLRNSRHNEATKDLEKNLPTFLNLSKKEHFADLTRRGGIALSEAPKITLGGLQEQIGDVSRLYEEITELLNLFFFSDPENQERIDNIVTFTKNFNGTPTFPTCKQLFPQLCQNLSICQHERAELMQLRNTLLLRASDLRLKAAPLYPPATGSLLPLDRRRLYDNHSVLFWQVGREVLENAFRATFQEKREKRLFLPDSFVHAVRRASQIDGYRDLNFNKLLYEGLPNDIPERFLCEVWAGFLGPASSFGATDDFMRHILCELPQQVFSKLENDLKQEEGKAQKLYNTVRDQLNSSIRARPITFMALSRWLDKARI